MQGQLQGTLTSIMSLTAIIGPPVMTYIFYLFTGDNAIVNFPGAPFAAGAVIMLLSIFITAYQLKRVDANKNKSG